MCVAVVVPAGVKLDEDTLNKMHAANRDSWGIATYDAYTTPAAEGSSRAPGYVAIVKGIGNTESMLEAYNQQLSIGKRAEHPHLIHFRIRTSGKTDVPNAHPFHIKHGALIHNGHLTGHHGGNFSDTYYWAKMFSDFLPKNLTEEQKAYLGKLIGNYNKLAMLFNDGTTAIINESAGTTLPNGVWVSNNGWSYRR